MGLQGPAENSAHRVLRARASLYPPATLILCRPQAIAAASPRLVPGAPRGPRMGESGRGPAAPRSSARNGDRSTFSPAGPPRAQRGDPDRRHSSRETKSLRPAVLCCAPALRLTAWGAVRSPPAGRSPSRPRWARPDEKQETKMATIGSFTKSENGDYTGSVKTLTLNVKARITPVDKANDKAPDFRIYAGRTDLGAAWKKTSNEGREYLLGQARRSELFSPDLRLAGRGRGRPLADLVAPQRRLTAIKRATPRPPGGAFASSSITRCEPAASAFRRDPSGLVPRPFARRPSPGAIGFIFRSHSKKAAGRAWSLRISSLPAPCNHRIIPALERPSYRGM